MEYTPFSHYINYSTGKHYTGSAYPTFGLDLKAAISSGNSLTEPAYQRLNVYIRQKVSLSAFSHLSYRLSVGGYITKDRVYAPDFYYVPTAPLFVTTRQPDESFMLPHNYTYLNGKWGQLSLKYSSGYLLLKRIPLLQRWKLNESLYLNSMVNKTVRLVENLIVGNIIFGFGILRVTDIEQLIRAIAFADSTNELVQQVKAVSGRLHTVSRGGIIPQWTRRVKTIVSARISHPHNEVVAVIVFIEDTGIQVFILEIIRYIKRYVIKVEQVKRVLVTLLDPCAWGRFPL